VKEQLADLERQGHLEPVGEEISLSAMLQQQGTFGSKMAEAQAHLDKLSELEGQCPTCEQEVDDEKVEELNTIYFNQKTIAENETVILKQKIAEAREHNKLVVIQKNQQRQYEDYIRDLDSSLPSTILDGDEISSSIDELSSKLRNIHSEIDRISAENMKAERHNTRVSIIQEQSEGMESQLEELVAALGKVEEQSAHLEILKKAFSTNGLLAYKIENLVKDLEDLTNEYLSELSDGRFSLEFVVTNDKLNVEITDNAKVVDILALSSGELARVNTATLLAIRKLMSSISSSRINTLFLDEIISVLDDEGKEKLVEILLGEELNTYIVSHGWTHPLLAKIEVIKEDNISRLE
jgi:DNA repair exonuclease SbcCD ATPase subunit